MQSVGKGRIAYDNTALTEEQSEVLKNFMDVYFDSLAGLSGSHGGRSSSWTGVDQFVQYARDNEGYGLLADTSLS